MKILIIDDEPAVVYSLERHFKKHHWKVSSAANYHDALQAVSNETFDAIICDHYLPSDKPGNQGLDLIKEIREKKITTPILFLTGCDITRVTPWDALNTGVDDFLKKPYHPEEIVARIKAIARRSFPCDNNSTNVITHKGVSLDLDLKKVFVDNKSVRLSSTLFLLLKKFMNNIGRFLPYEELIRYIWGESALLEEETYNTLRVHISYLRQALGKKHAACINTIYGRGYIWEDVEVDKEPKAKKKKELVAVK